MRRIRRICADARKSCGSGFLDVNVTRSILTEAADGTMIEDVRFGRPAKDGETFTKEGIYHFTVKNRYTGEENAKTIYVGVDKYLNAMSTEDLTVDEVNDQIAEGVVFEAVVEEPTQDTEPVTTKESTPLGLIIGAALLVTGCGFAGVKLFKKKL